MFGKKKKEDIEEDIEEENEEEIEEYQLEISLGFDNTFTENLGEVSLEQAKQKALSIFNENQEKPVYLSDSETYLAIKSIKYIDIIY